MAAGRIIFVIILLWISIKSQTQESLPPIGDWRYHLPYQSAISVAAGHDRIYCATPYSLFSIFIPENSTERLSRMSGLYETGVRTLCYDEVNEKLLIAYSNSNLDIIYRNDVFNVPDIKLDNISGDKTIYNIYSFGKFFYLSTGLGVIVVDGDKYEVMDTWFIRDGGGQVKVNGFTSGAGYYYAATADGLKRTPTSNPNPANYQNWENISGLNGLPAGSCDDVVTIAGKVIVLKNDTLFLLSNGNWNVFFTETGWRVAKINAASGKILVCQVKADGARIVSFNPDGSAAATIQQTGLIVQPRQAIFFNNDYWIADESGGLIKFSGSGFSRYQLNSPQSVASGEMLVRNEVFYAAAGAVSTDWIKQLNKNGMYQFSSGQWTNYNGNRFPLLDSLTDILSIAVDPRDESVWAGSYGGGLLHIRSGNNFEIYKQNTSLGQAIFDPGSYRVAGLAFDAGNNLWISNYGAAQNIVVRKPDGNWKTFSPPFVLSENAVAQVLVDDENQKWFVSPKGNGLICLNDGNTIDNTADDRWKLYRGGAGAGNLPSGQVLCVAKDKNGFVWIGTGDGIAIVECPGSVFSARGCEAVVPVVQQGNINSFLFKGEEINSIAVDGADRKWIATPNGAWLISPNGQKIIYRFTEENSFLLSNDVKKIAIDGKTGEVFFATAKGICSFRSTATEGSVRNTAVLVFPNPVPPGYSGTIAIRGLASQAIVKITEPDGRLVYQTRALGGQAVWDGRDYRGRKISSGVYLVLVSDEGRKENLAVKIVFIQK